MTFSIVARCEKTGMFVEESFASPFRASNWSFHWSRLDERMMEEIGFSANAGVTAADVPIAASPERNFLRFISNAHVDEILCFTKFSQQF